MCYKCNEKYFPGHQCAVKPLNKVFPADTEGDNSEQLDGTLEKHVEVEGEHESPVEHAVMSMHPTADHTSPRTMKFKGQVGGRSRLAS